MHQIYIFISNIRDVQYEHVTKIQILHSGDTSNSGFSLDKVIQMEKSEQLIGTLQGERHLL